MATRNNATAPWLPVLGMVLILLAEGAFQARAQLEAGQRSPELVFSTYLGGLGGDGGIAMERDYRGSLHLVGITASEDFPRVGTTRHFVPFFRNDVFRATLVDGQLRYSSFLNYPGHVFAIDLATWGPYLYLVGTGFDTEFQAGFANRSDVWNSWERAVQERFLPLFEPFEIPPDQAYSISSLGSAAAVDQRGDLLVAGVAQYPGEGRFHRQLVVAKLTPDLDTVWVRAVFDGASVSEAPKIAVDEADNVYVAGATSSTELPVTAGAVQESLSGGLDGFLVKLGPSGDIEYLTYLGGSGREAVRDVTVAQDGSAVVVGETSSADFPVRDALQASLGGAQDSFVAKVSPDGSALAFSTFLGGSGSEGVSAVNLAAGGSIFVAGTTESSDYPQVRAVPRPCATAPQLCGPSDAFVTELAPNGSALLFSTLLGGSGRDSAADLVVSPQEVALAGSTDSPDLPVVRPFQAALAGGSDAFVAVLKFTNQPPDCASARVSPTEIWPPNGRLVPVTLAVTDPDGDAVTLTIQSVIQDEPRSGAAPDAAGVGTPTAWVRADRQGGGDGRVYRIGFRAQDEFGATCSAAVTVCVPHDRRPGATCGEGGDRYDSGGSGG